MPNSEPARVTQADRDAAAKLWAAFKGSPAWTDWQADWMADGTADNGPIVQAFARHRAEALLKACEPWASYHGDLPDYDHPLRPVFESGIQYAVELLATELGVEDYTPCDGTEEFDGDLGGTLMNIVLEAMPKDEHDDPIYPRDLPAAIARHHLASTPPTSPGWQDYERGLEDAARAAEAAWPRAHTYASENADLYRAQDHVRDKIATAIRSLKSPAAPECGR